MTERTIQQAIRRHLERTGWLVEKTHGNMYQAGWPDLYCHHPDHGSRWIEVKTPTGRLTRSQRALFPRWSEYGVGIWILTDPADTDNILSAPPNWRQWYTPTRDPRSAFRG